MTFPHEFGRGLGFSQEVVDGFGCGAYRKHHLLNFTVGPATDFSTSELDVGENERPQPRMVAEKSFSHIFCFPFAKQRARREPHPTSGV